MNAITTTVRSAVWIEPLLVYLAIVNIAAFLAYGADKYKACTNRWRISEATLLLLAFAGGSVGALLGMLLFRHKIRKWKFRTAVPLFFLIHTVLLWIVLK